MDVENENHSKPSYFCYKFIKQTFLAGIWVCMGLTLEVVSPCIPELKDNIGLNYEEISRAMGGTSMGLAVAAVIGGILHERFYKLTDLIMAIGMIIGAVGIILIPWLPTMWTLALAFFCCGTMVSLNNPGGHAMCVHLWGDNAGPGLYSIATGFALGAFLGPQIAKPFLLEIIHGDVPSCSNNSILNETFSATPETLFTTPDGMLVNYSMSSPESGSNNPHLFLPFLIVGCVNLIFSLIFFLFYICGPPKGFPDRESAKSMKILCNPKSCADENSLYVIVLLTIIFFYYVHAVGGEHIYGKWIYSFAIETEVQFTKDQAANLASLFWFFHMVGRGSGMFFSKYVPTKIVIVLDCSIAIIVAILLCIYGHKSPIMLWILTALMGLLVAPLFSAGMLWTKIYMHVNSMSITTCMLGASGGYFFYVYAGGYILEYFGARYMMYVQLVYAVLALITFMIMESFVRCFSFKHNSSKSIGRDAEDMYELDSMMPN